MNGEQFNDSGKQWPSNNSELTVSTIAVANSIHNSSDKYHYIPAPPYFFVLHSIAAFEDAYSYQSNVINGIHAISIEISRGCLYQSLSKRCSLGTGAPCYSRGLLSSGASLDLQDPHFFTLAEEQDGVLNQSYLNSHGNVLFSFPV